MESVVDSRPEGRLIAGKYQLESKLGSGAMGSVYRARQLSLNRAVALKVLKVEAAQAMGGRKRFAREAQILTKLSHPNLVPVYDVGLDGDEPYIAMELVDGPSLMGLLERPAEYAALNTVAIAQGLVAGLAYSHQQGVFHRDIKPITLRAGMRIMPRVAVG
jgi:serine/threonine-protein kinase